MRPMPLFCPRMLPAAVVALSSLAVAPSGCAAVVGVEDFTVEGEGPGTGSTGTSMEDVCRKKVHGCERGTADNYADDVETEVFVSFGDGGYKPPCIRIRSEMQVIFNSGTHTFAQIPLVGGIAPVVDKTSAIPLTESMSSDATITFPEGCIHPYFSPKLPASHQGVVYVGGI